MEKERKKLNQILVSQKIYVTPELKRKKSLYKLQFVLSIFLLCLFVSFYIYAEYDKAKSEETGKMMLSTATNLQEAAQALKEEEYKVWVFVLEDRHDSGNNKKTVVSQSTKNQQNMVVYHYYIFYLFVLID